MCESVGTREGAHTHGCRLEDFAVAGDDEDVRDAKHAWDIDREIVRRGMPALLTVVAGQKEFGRGEGFGGCRDDGREVTRGRIKGHRMRHAGARFREEDQLGGFHTDAALRGTDEGCTRHPPRAPHAFRTHMQRELGVTCPMMVEHDDGSKVLQQGPDGAGGRAEFGFPKINSFCRGSQNDSLTCPRRHERTSEGIDDASMLKKREKGRAFAQGRGWRFDKVSSLAPAPPIIEMPEPPPPS